MKDAFAWACEFGHADVVAFLLGKGVAAGARLKHHGQTGLHWAAGGGHVETVTLLLAHRAPVNARDKEWEATPIQWAFYGWSNRASSADTSGSYYTVVALLAAAGASVEPEWLDDEKVRADPRMLAALTGREAQ
jgi:ankyrin repeat protein